MPVTARPPEAVNKLTTPKVPPTLALLCILAVLLISTTPVTLNATPGAVLLIPTRLFKASINKVPESKLVLVVPSFTIL